MECVATFVQTCVLLLILLIRCLVLYRGLQALRDAVAVVPQDTMLFNDTLMQNIRSAGRVLRSCCRHLDVHAQARLQSPMFSIFLTLRLWPHQPSAAPAVHRYGRPGASDEQVIEAARMARLHDAVMRMPDKYSTGEALHATQYRGLVCKSMQQFAPHRC